MTEAFTEAAHEQPSSPLRRMMLGAIAGTFALGGCARANAGLAATADEEEVFNSYNRTREFTNGEMDGPAWVADKQGNFDLSVAEDNHLATLKMTSNLVGKRTYVPMLVRQLISREDLPGGLLLGAAAMFTWQWQVPDPEEFGDLPEGTHLMRSMYTAVYLDPKTMEPVQTLTNPFNGTEMKLEDYIFIENFLSFPKGGSRFVEELQFSNDDPDKPRFNLIKDWGDELMLFNGGIYSEPGKHQPRFTENTWRSNRAAVMDPGTSLVDTSYNFMGVNKAFEKPWAGYGQGDADNLMSLATGKKVHRPDDLPEIHKRLIAERYPHRL